LPEFREHEEMAKLLHTFVKPETQIEGKGIGHPWRQHLYRPDEFWKVDGRWVCVEIETQPSRNLLEGKLRKANSALEEVRNGWEPSRDKLMLRPVLEDLKANGLRILIGIPQRAHDYSNSERFQGFMETASELGIGISLYAVDVESGEVVPVALRHVYAKRTS
jgi:hypothetical protein